jgi:hypothetical protein
MILLVVQVILSVKGNVPGELGNFKKNDDGNASEMIEGDF